MESRQGIIKYCNTLPSVYEDYPFHDANWTVMRCKENKKTFALIYEKTGHIWINVKVSPDWIDFWRNVYTSVIPAYHMNKKYWNSIIVDGSVPDEEVRRMIAESYDLVKPKKRTIKTKEGLGFMEYEKRIPIITVCGDDCSVCPRYTAKTVKELSRVAEFWYQVGWRDHIVSPDEIKCTGCQITNNCRYKLLPCTIEHGVAKCKECSDYPCDKIKYMLEQSNIMEQECKKLLPEEQFKLFKRAFYEKEQNLNR